MYRKRRVCLRRRKTYKGYGGNPVADDLACCGGFAFWQLLCMLSQRERKRRYVDSVFHAAYRREVFRTVGGFNECLGRTEDNELHYRIRKAGYKICCEPKIKSYQYIRSGLIKMMKQKYGNGLWVALTLGVSPGCISLFHLAPLALVLMLIVFSVMAGLGCAAPLVLLCCAYLFLI